MEFCEFFAGAGPALWERSRKLQKFFAMFRKFPLSCRIFPRCRSGKNLSQHVGQPGCSRVSRGVDSFSGSRSDSGGRAGCCGACFHTVCNHRAHVRFFSDATRAGFQYSMVAQETQPEIPLWEQKEESNRPVLRKENRPVAWTCRRPE